MDYPRVGIVNWTSLDLHDNSGEKINKKKKEEFLKREKIKGRKKNIEREKKTYNVKSYENLKRCTKEKRVLNV